MKEFEFLDDQILSAFVDGQLDDTTSASVIMAMEIDSDVRSRVYQLRRAKDLVKIGFKNARAPSSEKQYATPRNWKKPSLGIAASFAIIVASFIAGSFGYYYSQQTDSRQNITVASIAQEENSRIILHISEADPMQFSAALDYTDQFLKEHGSQNGQIAVIAHASGIDLMRAGESPFEERVKMMMRDHGNVYFIACAQAIRTLQMQGVDPHMLENTIIEKPAMDQIIERVQSGWRYVKVKSLMEI